MLTAMGLLKNFYILVFLITFQNFIFADVSESPLDFAKKLVSMDCTSNEFEEKVSILKDLKNNSKDFYSRVVYEIRQILENVSEKEGVSGWIALLAVREKDAVEKCQELILIIKKRAIQIALIKALQYYHPIYPRVEIIKKLIFMPDSEMALEVKIATLDSLMTIKDDKAVEVCRLILSDKFINPELKALTIGVLAFILNYQEKSMTKEELDLLFTISTQNVAALEKTYNAWITSLKLFFRDHPEERNNVEIARKVGQRLSYIVRYYAELMGEIDPMANYELVEKNFTGQAKEVFKNSVKFGITYAENLDACSLGCELVSRVSEWITNSFFDETSKSYDNINEWGWKYSLSALSALFLAKSVPYCPHAVDALEYFSDTIKYLDAKENLKVNNDFETLKISLRSEGLLSSQLEEFLNNFADNSEKDHPSTSEFSYNPLPYYGNIFYSLFLDELLYSDVLKKYRDETQGEKLKAISSRLYENLLRFEQGISGISGSVWQTYLLGLATVTTSTDKKNIAHDNAINRLETLRNIWGPCEFPYRPYTGKGAASNDFTNDVGAMVPRSITANLAIYLDGLWKNKSPSKLLENRESLMESLICFRENGWKVSLQLSGSQYHSHVSSGIGSHFLYPNLPYIVAAARILLKDPNLSLDQKEELKAIDEYIHSYIISLKKKDGFFRRMGTLRYFENSLAYILPLAGLASIQYCDRNNGKAGFSVLPRKILPAFSKDESELFVIK